MGYLDFYSRSDIQEELIKISKNREFAAKFGENFGKRPDTIGFKKDIYELARQGATSFHISEERWADPLRLKAGMSKKELDDLRIGWDFLIDIDSKNLEYSKICAKLIVDALRFHDVKNISVKFSGNLGFHIGIPFESFPSKVNDKEIRLLFPDALRIVIDYLKNMIKDHLIAKLGKENYSKVGIDTILVSSRHMFRAPYSLHEKTGLVSLPIMAEHILDFDINEAKPENVKTNIKFLEHDGKVDAKYLIMQTFDFAKKGELLGKASAKDDKYEIPKTAITEEFFPPCIRIASNGLEDGKKRFVFIATNFLKSLGWKIEDIEKYLLDWNKRNNNPLKDGYIINQMNWFKRQSKAVLPPNCNNQMYYVSIGICHPDNLCKLIKNPANYARRKFTNFKAKDLKSSKRNKD